jgi:hypothetical protein
MYLVFTAFTSIPTSLLASNRGAVFSPKISTKNCYLQHPTLNGITVTLITDVRNAAMLVFLTLGN